MVIAAAHARSIAAALLLIASVAAPSTASEQQQCTASLGHPAAEVAPVPSFWSVINTFDAVYAWSQNNAGTQPAASRYPFLRFAQLFTATGGCTKSFPGCKTIFDNDEPWSPGNPGNFTRLKTAITNVLATGLKPYLVTGMVPINMSTYPQLGGFSVNTAPPTNYTLYSMYIHDMASSLLATFGEDELALWRWGVLTEYNNPQWFQGGENGTNYLQLYDFTVCGLSRALGRSLKKVGAHACTVCGAPDYDTGWSAELLLKHIATGKDFCTGAVGSGRLDFWTGSFYASKPGNEPPHTWTIGNFDAVITDMRASMRRWGIDVPLGYDEGRIISGPDGLQLMGSRAVGHAYQSTFDALLFHVGVLQNVSYMARWSVNTGSNTFAEAANATVDHASTNVARLTHRLAGDMVLTSSCNTPLAVPSETSNHGGPVPGPPMTNSTVAVLFTQPSAQASRAPPMSVIARALAYNFQPYMSSNVSAVVEVRLCGLSASTLNVTAALWQVDGQKNAFWEAWQADMEAHNTTWPSGLSAFDETAPGQVAWRPGFTEWMPDRLPAYRAMVNLTASAGPALDCSMAGCCAAELQLPPHGVGLLEFYEAASSS